MSSAQAAGLLRIDGAGGSRHRQEAATAGRMKLLVSLALATVLGLFFLGLPDDDAPGDLSAQTKQSERAETGTAPREPVQFDGRGKWAGYAR